MKDVEESSCVPYLLLSGERSSSLHRLPPDSMVTIGSDPSSTIVVDDGRTPDIVALIETSETETKLTPRSRIHGHCVLNGRPLTEPRALSSGDELIIGHLTIVYQGCETEPKQASLLSTNEVRDRLGREIERSLRTQSPLSVMFLTLGTSLDRIETLAKDVASVLRREDLVGWEPEGELLIVLPDTGANARVPSQRIMEVLSAENARAYAGIALCPDDVQFADGLITGARLASETAEAGEVATIESAAVVVDLAPTCLVLCDPKMRSLLELTKRLASSPLPVLISGETGVGKELFAIALHQLATRASEPMVSINCATLSEPLFESELFGHERGAFTGAVERKEGLFERAGAGTIFLDEIGECPLPIQAKLLRAVESKRASRLGSTREYDIGARLITATNRDLEAEIERGSFRRDLFYRLSAATLQIPPLRERPLDLSILARSFLKEACQIHDRPNMAIEANALQRIGLHDWPGNVRELKNVMSISAATIEGDRLEASELPDTIGKRAPKWLLPRKSLSPEPSWTREPEVFRPIRDEVRELERTRMVQALRRTGGVRARAAELITMPLRTFVSKMKSYSIDIPAPSQPRKGST